MTKEERNWAVARGLMVRNAKFTPKIRTLVRQWHGTECYYCGVRVGSTDDHMVPRAAGGIRSLDNLVPACFKCNNLKDSLSLEEFRYAYFGGFAFYGEFRTRVGPYPIVYHYLQAAAKKALPSSGAQASTVVHGQ